MRKQLTIHEKWAFDVESYKSGGSVLVAKPICRDCQYNLKGNVFHCKKYIEEEKPKDVILA